MTVCLWATQGFIFISGGGGGGGGGCMVVHWYFIEAPTSRCTHTIHLDPKMEYWGEGGTSFGEGGHKYNPPPCPLTIHSYGKNPNFEIFFEISRNFNLSDLWGLPSWCLGLSVKKKFRCLATSLQVNVTTLYLNEYLPFWCEISTSFFTV